jgi:hypothetical protein
MYEMINEFLGKQFIFQPSHLRHLVVDGDGIFKLVGQTPKCPIELNDNSIALELGVPRVNLDATINKVYAHNIDETWLYEQPQSIEPIRIKHVNLLKATTPLQSPPLNPMTLLDQHTVLLHIPSSNPTTLKSINKT